MRSTVTEKIIQSSSVQSNANKEYVPQAFLLDENSQRLLKQLLDSATEELLARQSKVLAQAQLGLQERVSNSVSRGIVKLPSKVGLSKEVVDSIERIETQLSAFQFCSSRGGGDRTRSCKSPPSVVVTPLEEEEEEDYYSSSVMPFQMEPRQSYSRSRTRRTSSVAPSLTSLNNTRVRRSRYDPSILASYDDQIVLATSRPPLPPLRPLRAVGFEKPRQSNRTSQKMKPTLLLDQGTETGTTSSEGGGEEEQVYSTDHQESEEEASRETVSTSGSSWETHAESVTESDSSYQSETDDDDDDDNSQVSDSPPPHNRSRYPSKQRKKATGRLKRFKDKLGKVFHHHHYHHHEHHNKEEGHKPSAWKQLVKKHLQKDKEKLVEKRIKTESKGLKTHNNNNKGGQFQTLVKGFMRHHRRHSKQKLKTPKRQGGVKIPKGGRLKKLDKTNYLCNKDQQQDEN